MNRNRRLANRKNYGQYRGNNVKYLVYHYTANDGDTDEANANYFANNVVQASAHYFVDDDSITLTVPEDYAAWAVGGGRQGSGGGRFFKICTNTNSISIELCDTHRNGKYDFSPKTLDNAVELGREIMARYNIDIDHVIRHYDVTGKICPKPFVDNEEAWIAFKNRLVGVAVEGWVNNGWGWWYQYLDGTYPHDEWKKLDAWYYFDSSGYAVTGWHFIGGQWFYFGSDCRMVEGWVQIDGIYYYLREGGYMARGWQKIGEDWFYFNYSGEMQTGWQKIDGLWYYFNENGYMLKGWLKYKNQWYYLANLDKGYKDGQMVTDAWILHQNAWYRLGSDGIMLTDTEINFKIDENGVAKEKTDEE